MANALCTSWKVEILQGFHNHTSGSGGGSATTGNAFKIALYTSSASGLGAATTAYSATNEVSGSGYSAGGEALTNVTPTSSSTTSFLDWADVTWSSSSITTRFALVYNSTVSNKAVLVLDFSSDQTSSSGDLTISWPTADASSAIIRIA
jgi:hypothetical protein